MYRNLSLSTICKIHYKLCDDNISQLSKYAIDTNNINLYHYIININFSLYNLHRLIMERKYIMEIFNIN